jgi:hypothetical protein
MTDFTTDSPGSTRPITIGSAASERTINGSRRRIWNDAARTVLAQ